MGELEQSSKKEQEEKFRLLLQESIDEHNRAKDEIRANNKNLKSNKI
jgi:hypothetical protein